MFAAYVGAPQPCVTTAAGFGWHPSVLTPCWQEGSAIRTPDTTAAMDTANHLWLYFLLVLSIVLVPGMDMLFVLANALVGGARAGIAATVGIMLGGLCHTVIGLSAVTLLSSLLPSIGQAMLVIGSLYMVWIGIGLVRSTTAVAEVDASTPPPVTAIMVQGFVTCLVNPKAWLFVFAVFPQFIRPDRGSVLPQAAAIALITVVVQGAVYGSVALAGLKARDALVGSRSAAAWSGRFAGILLILLALAGLWQAVMAR